ncbi:hypothetical protein E1B28_000091 [Marasmius oreades]|uniref:F-box domain-containing protein n=1 Tax=Marasmius oreades TaxID=181124 RepID=A0A9P7V0N8_9AGAR|nr:uncharacterized protein E1B28_000091 [Marasmius oreades]KAG7098119.1 hypothetical protein E1B28_000091 [Marasmius oreades]
MSGKRKKQAKPPPADADDDGNDRKRARASVKRGRKVTQSKESDAQHYLQEMPLNLLYQIFSHLEPYDLVIISRTCKQLRQIILNHSATTVWTTARANAGLPDPFPTMSEPAFVSLLFDPNCHFCGNVARGHVKWSALVRVCKDCLSKEFAPLAFISNGEQLPPALLNTLPQYYDSSSKATYYLKDLSKQFVDEYLSLSSEDAETWLSQKVEMSERVQERVGDCKTWLSAQQGKRKLGLKEARVDRINAITRRVQELGWSPVLTLDVEFRNHRLVNQTKPLTEAVWAKIKPEIEFFLPSLHDKVLLKLKKDRFRVLQHLLRSWDDQQTYTFVTPSHHDIGLWEPFKSVIESLPLDGGSDPSIFNDALQQLSTLVEEWNRKQTQKILGALREYQPDATEADLHLSTSLFNCPHCTPRDIEDGGVRIFGYPAVLLHNCWTTRNGSKSRDFDFEAPEWYYKDGHWHDAPSVVARVEVDYEAVEITKKIGAVYGIDVTSTRMSTMMALNPLLQYAFRGEKVFTAWGNKVCVQRGWEGIEALTEDLILEEDILQKKACLVSDRNNMKRYYLCKECPSFRSSLQNVKRHLKETHKIEFVREQHWDFSPLASLDTVFSTYRLRERKPGG